MGILDELETWELEEMEYSTELDAKNDRSEGGY